MKTSPCAVGAALFMAAKPGKGYFVPKKSERLTALPADLVPLLSQREIETYYSVSDWQILQWIKQGMPVAPFAGRQRRFDINEVRDWMAAQSRRSSRG